MSDVLLVLGMHRSGTSSVAGSLMKLGGGKPKHPNKPSRSNPRGYFESDPLIHLHDEILASAGSKWSDWRAFNPSWFESPTAVEFRKRARETFAAEFEGSALAVMKDPRVCRLSPFWFDVFREMAIKPHVAMPIRSPLDVAHSLGAAEGLSVSHGLLLWLRHVLDAEWHSRSTARSIFTWRDFRADWRAVCNRISAETDLAWPRLSDRAGAEIDRFLTRELVHHETDDVALAVHSEVNEWTLRAYEALLELARNPQSNSAMATLDDVRKLLDDASHIFGRLLVDYEIDIEETRERLNATSAERDALQARQLEILAEKAAAVAELAARAEAAERAFGHSAEEKSELSQALAAAAAELQTRQQDLEARSAALAEQAQRLEAAERAREASAEEKNELSQALAAAAAELQTRQQDLEARSAALAEQALRLEAAERAREASAEEKNELSQALAAALAEREALRAAHAAAAAQLQTRQQDLEARSAALAEQSLRLEAAERAREASVEEKNALSQALAAVLAEQEAQRISRVEAAATHQATESELRRSRLTLDDLSRRVEGMEREKLELQQRLETSFAERDEVDRGAARLLEELAGERSQVADFRARAQTVESELDEARRLVQGTFAERDQLATAFDRAERDRQSLSGQKQQLVEELERVRADSNRQAAEREAAYASELAEAQRAHEARIQGLRAELVDAEAAFAVARRDKGETAFLNRLRPLKARHRRVAKDLIAAGVFDAEFYRAHYPEALTAASTAGAGADLAAALHYVEEGFCRGCRPNAMFDSRWYLDHNDDVRRSGINPLLHYHLDGWREGRDPSPEFQTAYYLESNQDVRGAKIDPLAHYLNFGRHEGRRPRRPQ